MKPCSYSSYDAKWVMERFNVKLFHLLRLKDWSKGEARRAKCVITTRIRQPASQIFCINPSIHLFIPVGQILSNDKQFSGVDVGLTLCINMILMHCFNTACTENWRGEQGEDDSCWRVQSGAAPLNWRMNRREPRRDDDLREPRSNVLYSVGCSLLTDESIVVLMGSCMRMYERTCKGDADWSLHGG